MEQSVDRKMREKNIGSIPVSLVIIVYKKVVFQLENNFVYKIIDQL